MPKFQCYPISNPNSQYFYCPSFGAAILFCCLFGLTTTGHVFQAILYKKPFAWVLIMGGLWEFLGYIFRTLSVEQQLNEGYGTAQLLLILLAPLWINAFVYMTLGRMIHFYLDDDKVFGIKAKRVTLIFVLFDITAFVIQATGGTMTTPGTSTTTQELGLHIYMGGVGLQLLSICIFVFLAGRFQFKIKRQETISLQGGQGISMTDVRSPTQARRLLYLTYTVLGLIIFRNIYRLVEFSAGVFSNITMHEWYAYVFDATPMLFALICFHLFHPGRILRGPKSDFSEDHKRAKAEKKAKKEIKRAEKETKKTDKLAARAMKEEEKKLKKTETKHL